MIKQFLLFLCICLGVSSSVYGASLTTHEKEELETLQRSVPRLKEMAAEVNNNLRDNFGKVPTQWVIPPEKDALLKLVELCSTPECPWPAIFPQSKDQRDVPNMLQYEPQMRQIYKVDFFWRASLPCVDALSQRKSTGKGLAFENAEHLAKFKKELDVLGHLMADLLPIIDSLQPIFNRFSGNFCNIYFLIMQTENGGPFNPKLGATPFQDQFKHDLRQLEISGKAIDPSLKTTTATVQDEFVKTKLFLDAVLSVHALALNALGTLLQMHALKYETCGDGSLLTNLPKVMLQN